MILNHFSPDIKEFLKLLYKYSVKYLIVGGEAVIYYGYPRFTGDIDIFYENSETNIEKLFDALKEFWNNKIPGIKRKDELKKEGVIIQFGISPNRIDLMNKITGVNFLKAWNNKKREWIKTNKEKIPIYYIGKKDLIKNKKAIKRPKDIQDLNYLK